MTMLNLEVFPEVKVIKTLTWNQTVMPNAGTKIGFRKGGWELFREAAGKDWYEATAIYLGHQLAALEAEASESEAVI